MDQHIEYCISVIQPKIQLAYPFTSDPTTISFLQWVLPKNQIDSVKSQLVELGELCIHELHKWEIECERVQPKWIQYDVYGKIVDEVIVGEGWKQQKQYAAKQGIVALAYEESNLGKLQRFIQLIRLSMYSPYSGLYSCPLAMTDGAASILKDWLLNPTTQDSSTNEFVVETLRRLTSRDPGVFWTSGQWMTEKRGGSDVSRSTETQAVHYSNNIYKLYGVKWFTSAIDSDVSITLAKIGNKLSMFLLRVKDQDGLARGLRVTAMKDKMGTRQLPTAELLLNGVEAYLISEQGRGISSIVKMLNVTRLYNAASAVGSMRRIYLIVLDYSTKRQAFGKLLCNLPSHQTLLIQFSLFSQATTLFYLKCALMFSYIQHGSATSDQQDLFRLLVPLLKLYTAKTTVHWMSEGMEALGALGYMENSGIPVALRDAQVLKIWEGTTNVLCLDFLRALTMKGKDKMHMLNVYNRYHLGVMMNFICSETKITDRDIQTIHAIAKITNNHNALISELNRAFSDQKHMDITERNIRDIALLFCENFIAIEMLDRLIRNGRDEDLVCFKLWVQQMPTFKLQTNDAFEFEKMVKKDMKFVYGAKL